jgi:NAD(P)-dependent dehydrogenase (short-subunit alcohol dehydrogenase family)
VVRRFQQALAFFAGASRLYFLVNTGADHASKWALEGLSQALAAEVARFGVKITLIEPSGYSTDWAGPSARHAAELPAHEPVHEQAVQASARRFPAQGDPAATPQAVMQLVDTPNPPLRLFLGEAPLGMATADYETPAISGADRLVGR